MGVKVCNIPTARDSLFHEQNGYHSAPCFCQAVGASFGLKVQVIQQQLLSRKIHEPSLSSQSLLFCRTSHEGIPLTQVRFSIFPRRPVFIVELTSDDAIMTTPPLVIHTHFTKQDQTCAILVIFFI